MWIPVGKSKSTITGKMAMFYVWGLCGAIAHVIPQTDPMVPA